MPQRKGFTLIELLVAIGIMVVLIAAVAVGVAHLVSSGKVRQTKVVLQNCRNMMAELEVSGGAAQQPTRMYVNGSSVPYTTTPFDIWRYYDISRKTTTPDNGALTFPNSQRWADVRPSGVGRFESDAVANTQIVMGKLRAVPNNRTAIANMGAERFLEPHPSTANKLTPNPQTTPPKSDPPIVLDAWSNPIIFVPAAGLRVTVTNRSGGQGAETITIKSPDNRPFWASAGPDGCFSDDVNSGNDTRPLGDDNVYSFEQ